MMRLFAPTERNYNLLDILIAASLFGLCCFVVSRHQGFAVFLTLLALCWQSVLIALLCGVLICINWGRIPYLRTLPYFLWLGSWANAIVCGLHLIQTYSIDEKWFVGVLGCLTIVVEVATKVIVGKRSNDSVDAAADHAQNR